MWVSAFLFGLLSSLHCIGMCGPIAMMLPVSRENPTKKVVQLLIYHSGRLLAYSCIGLIFGLAGRAFYLAGMQQKLSIFAGIAMLCIALVPEKTFSGSTVFKPVQQIFSALKNVLGAQFKKRSFGSFFSIGLLNGFLPCGLVYAATFGALAQENLLEGTFFMLCFGLGTLPLMSAVGYIQSAFSPTVRARILKLVPFAVGVIGLLFILRGMGLGIPYVSPANLQLFVKADAACH